MVDYKFFSIGILVFLLGFLLACQLTTPDKLSIDSAMKNAEAQLNKVSSNPSADKIPRSIHNDGSMYYAKPGDWTCGFFPGSLWYLYEFTGNKVWKDRAKQWTSYLNEVQYKTTTHDLGFMMYCSYGNGLRLTEDSSYMPILVQTAKSLLTRYNPKTGVIKSWDKYPWSAKWQYPVIIDNMMNLELLFWATKATGDSTYYKVAKSHALTTMKNHFRKDNSSYHVVDYDSISGKVIQKTTHQGTADESSWVRGQGWGLYGFTVCYRETGDTVFLAQAEKIASFILNHPNLPTDFVPYWDFDASNIPDAPRDASAAALIASALIELSSYSEKNKSSYLASAKKILTSLGNPTYTAKVGTNNDFILMHSTGNFPNGTEIDKPLCYADYYYLEALVRYNRALKSNVRSK